LSGLTARSSRRSSRRAASRFHGRRSWSRRSISIRAHRTAADAELIEIRRPARIDLAGHSIVGGALACYAPTFDGTFAALTEVGA
jgi:hypothetical protein